LHKLKNNSIQTEH